MDPTHTDGGPVERKVQLTGGSTYTVSIPKAWADDRDIGSGSRVHVYPFEDRLVVARPGEGAERRARINVDTAGDGTVGRRIAAAYAAGSDRIVVESDTGFTADQRRVASGEITGLIGVEIAEETERRIVARSLLDPGEVSLDRTIDQLRRLSLSMHESAIEAVVDPDGAAPEVASREADVDRLFALVSRQFYRVLVDVRVADELGTGRKTALSRFRVARQLERVADHAERIAGVADRQTAAPDADLAEEFETAARAARRVVRTALEGNTGEALLRRDELLGRLDELDRELYASDHEDVYLYGQVLESIRRTAEYGGNVAEIVTLGGITETERT